MPRFIGRKECYEFLPPLAVRSKTLAKLLGRDEGEISAAFLACEVAKFSERDAIMANVLGDLSKVMSVLVGYGVMLPTYEVVSDALGPLAVVEQVPRIDKPVGAIISKLKS